MNGFGVSARVGYDSSPFYKRNLYSGMAAPRKGQSPYHENVLAPAMLDQVYQQSSERMTQLPDNSVHLMVTSPPYNVGKDYDNDLSLKAYLAMLMRVWEETYRVLVPGGRACINIANVGRKPYIPLNSIITSDLLALGFYMRGEIIWNKSASAGTSCAWGSWQSPSNPVLRDTHEYILVFCKERFERKKPTSPDKRSTIRKDQFLEYTKSTWTFPAASAKQTRHPAPFPIELPARLIQLYTYTHDVVLDPFLGSGTTALAARQAGRYFVGYELSPEYARVAKNRISVLL